MMHGVLLIDKPDQMTSHDVVAQVRRVFAQKQVGHAGTLDPAATGLLVVMLGKATKLSNDLSGDDKAYWGACKWGARTDTQDAQGKIVQSSEAQLPTEKAVRDAMRGFVGQYDQVVPIYSAKKIDGARMHRQARKGRELPEKRAMVRIDSLELESMTPDGFSFRVACGKGTYIRALVDDLCVRLGGLGHLCALRRERSGGFFLTDAVELSFLKQQAQTEAAGEFLIPMDKICGRFPAVTVTDQAAGALVYGHIPLTDTFLQTQPFAQGDTIRFVDARLRLLAVAVALIDSGQLCEQEKGRKVVDIRYNFSAQTP